MLPATVDGTNASVLMALARAKGNFWYTYLRLVYGPTLFTIVSIAILFGLVYLNIPIDMIDQTGGIDILGTLVLFLYQVFGLFGTALAATVLCKTYLRSQDQATRPEQAPGAAG